MQGMSSQNMIMQLAVTVDLLDICVLARKVVSHVIPVDQANKPLLHQPNVKNVPQV